MKNSFIKTACLLSLISFSEVVAQEQQTQTDYVMQPKEKFGKTLNVGAGIGYYYNGVGLAAPAAMLNYEFDVFRNFTLAPFAGISVYQNSYYWGNPNAPYTDPSYRYYNYREVIIPVGAKASYYFDEWLRLNPHWDLYVGTSVGFAFRTVMWDNNYNGDRGAYQEVNPLYVAMHVGGEYHITRRTGLFLDLSTGISTFGLALHFNK